MPQSYYKSAEFDAYAKSHDGVRDYFRQPPRQVGTDPVLKTPIYDDAERYIVVFNDGTEFTMAWDPANEAWHVEDPGNAEKSDAKSAAMTPEERRLTELEIAQREANLTKSQRDLAVAPEQKKGDLESAFSDLDATIEAIRQKWATGQITATEANRQMAQARQAFDSTISGASEFERQQADRNAALNRGQMGAGMLNQRVSSGTSMVNQLVAGANDAFGKMLPGGASDAALGFNPYRLAQRFTTEMGGGQQVYDAASQMVMGAAANPTAPGYWVGTEQEPGDPGSQQADAEQTTPGGQPWYPPSVPYGPNYPASQSYPPGGVTPPASTVPQLNPQPGVPYMPNDPSTWWR